MKLKFDLHLLLILLLPCYFCCSSSSPSNINGELSPAQGLHQDNTIVVDGIERVYDHYVPGDLGAASIPIVLLLRGGGSSIAELVLGKQNHDIEMVEEIWNFFREKQL